jgi:hypothetical protein
VAKRSARSGNRRIPLYNPAVPKKPNPPRQCKVGDRVRVSIHGGKVVEAVIKAVIDRRDALHFQIDFGNQQTALVADWQIVKD